MIAAVVVAAATVVERFIYQNFLSRKQNVGGGQCDQMVILLFQYLAIHYNENVWPNLAENVVKN